MTRHHTPPHPNKPSIIIEGPEAWAEDGWHRIAIGGFGLRVVKPCSRCKMPNIDQATSEMDMVVTAALKTFRCARSLDAERDAYISIKHINIDIGTACPVRPNQTRTNLPISRPSQHRTGEHLGITIGDKTDVYFGQNVVNDKRTGMLRVGDAVTVFS